jgi:hypothetical protein
MMLRLLNVIGSETDILIQGISTFSLILLGVCVGVLVSQKKIRVRAMLARFLLFVLGFLAAPFVGVGVLLLRDAVASGLGSTPAIFGVSIIVYLLFYMGFWVWLKKKGIVRFADDW